MPVYNSLKFKIPMELEGFDPLWHEDRNYNPGKFHHLSLTNASFQKQYDSFKERVLNCIGKTFLPVYRMSDGEFKFCLGETGIKKRILSALRINDNYLSTCWGEAYTKKEIKEAWDKFIDNLKRISGQGYLAIHFVENALFKGYTGYIKLMSDWFDRHNIQLTESNYISFYMIYAILCGRDSIKLFQNRRILIITSDYDDRFIKLEKELQLKYQIECVSFYEISRTKSLLEKINFKKINGNVDLVLIGAGIGSLNILMQLSALNTVCIDAGIVLDALVNKNRNTSRLFLKGM